MTEKTQNINVMYIVASTHSKTAHELSQCMHRTDYVILYAATRRFVSIEGMLRIK